MQALLIGTAWSCRCAEEFLLAHTHGSYVNWPSELWQSSIIESLFAEEEALLTRGAQSRLTCLLIVVLISSSSSFFFLLLINY